MGKIKNLFNKISLRNSFILYTAIFIIIAFLLTIITGNIADNIWQDIEKSYMNEDGSLIVDGDTYFGITIIPPGLESSFSQSDRIIYTIFKSLSTAAAPICFSVCIVMAAFLFYRNKLKKPLEILSNAADNITENNLDFTFSYEKNDEMGKLCSSFEKMRVALQENNLEMWRQMDERKRLNAAFSHDLRTPLTVLKGQSEMLLKYVPDGKLTTDKITDIVGTMKSHITRMENYVFTMNNLQKLTDIDIQKTDVPTNEICSRLKESGMIISADKKLIFDDAGLTAETFNVDMGVVMRVYENILSNAIRFAKNRIIVTLSDDGAFSITIFDDGQGFSDKDLLDATNPFYKSDDSSENQHFGMGLNICKVLCEKHGGYIKLSNNSDGATVKAAF